VIKDKYNTLEQVIDANNHGIHIEVIGDFNQYAPTSEQYDAINQILYWIEERRIKE